MTTQEIAARVAAVRTAAMEALADGMSLYLFNVLMRDLDAVEANPVNADARLKNIERQLGWR